MSSDQSPRQDNNLVTNEGLTDLRGPSVESAELQAESLSTGNGIRRAGKKEYNPDKHIGKTTNRSDLDISLKQDNPDRASHKSTSHSNKREGPKLDLEVAKRNLLSDIKLQARNQARRDFDTNPASQANLEESAKRIEVACLKAGINIDRSLQSAIQKTFEAEYTKTHNRIYRSELNWFQRRYYDTSSLFSRSFSGFTSAVGGIAKKVNYGIKATVAVASAGAELVVDTAKAAGNAIEKIGSSIANSATGVANGVRSIAKGAKDASAGLYKLATDTELQKKAWDLYVKIQTAPFNLKNWQYVGNQIGKGADAVATWVSTPGNWIKLGNNIKAGLASAADFVTSPETWKSLGTFAVTVFTDPAKAWEEIKSSTVGGFIYDMGESLGINSLLRGTGNLLYAPLELQYNLGMTAANLLSDLYNGVPVDELKNNLKNNFSNALSQFSTRSINGLEAVKGGVLLAGEVTGITDAILTIKHGAQLLAAYGRGDEAAMIEHGLMFGVHAASAAMSIGSIVATVSTAGAAAGTIVGAAAARSGLKTTAKNILKTAAKEFVETSATKMGKEVVERISKTLTPELLEAQAREIADKGATKLSERIAKEGSEILTKETKSIMAEQAEIATKKLLQEADLVKHVDELTTELLEGIHNTSTKKLTKELESQGIENASRLARELKSLVKSGKGDAELKQILEDRITKEITDSLQSQMETGFKQQFRSHLDGTLKEIVETKKKDLLKKYGVELAEDLPRAARAEFDTLAKQADNLSTLKEAAEKEAKRLGKELDEYIDDVIEEGWAGVKEGIEAGTRKLVREGIEAAFKKFRAKLRPRGIIPDVEQDSDGINFAHNASDIEDSKLDFSSKQDDSLVGLVFQDENKVEFKVVHRVVNGVHQEVYMRFDPELNSWLEDQVIDLSPEEFSDTSEKLSMFGPDSENHTEFKQLPQALKERYREKVANIANDLDKKSKTLAA